MLFAYVDESGDRGVSQKSSPYFMMGAVVVEEAKQQELSNAIASIKSNLHVPPAKPLHWSEHCKDFARRQMTAGILGRLGVVQLSFVVIKKATIPPISGGLSNHERFYNYTAGILMDRILLGAQYWPGGPQHVHAFYGHVRGMNHETTLDYFRLRRERASYTNWSLLEGPPKFVATNTSSGVQAADQYVGMLKLAIQPDEFGGYEPMHLLAVRHQIRRGPSGEAVNYGFKCLAEPGFPQSLPWWPNG